MSLKIVVLAKQVPDTRNVGKDAMTAEGTVNRAALPAIFNPEDLNALEQALRLKEQNPGSTVGILTMGPPRAGEIIRQGLYRGADTELVMKYKYATCPMERKGDEPYTYLYNERPYLTLNQWSVADVDGDAQQCGLSGSPTKVKAVQSIVFQAKESKTLTPSDADVESLVKELLDEKIIG
jgi:electron transfer flavoprotein alpha/beta subunit